MYLKGLEISGFKSFAKKSSLEFTSTITGIVGPNGSGKSNIAEAFRFVLGEQSIKSLRGKRGEDLIWNGGGDSGRANRASVKLTFDNTKRIFPAIDFDQITIERIVHRDNVNEYFLNGNQVRLKDISELLLGAHIGSTGHHIISQGEADRILSASISERREMIEDALGLKIYQWKKSESLKKLDKTSENMKQVESLRREIAPHIKFLKKQVEKIEKAEEMRKELTALYRDYFANEEIYIVHNKNELQKQIATPKTELDVLDKELEQARNILINSKHKDKKSDSLIQNEKALFEIRQKRDVLTRDIGRIEGEISTYKKTVEKEIEKQKQEDTKTIYLKDLETVVGDIENLKSINDATRLFTEVIIILKNFINKHKKVLDSDFLKDIEKEISVLENKKDTAESLKKTADAEESALVKQYNELKRLIEKEKDVNRDAEKDVFRIIARQNELRGVLNTLNIELEHIIQAENNFKKELTEAGITVGREAINYPKITIYVDNIKTEQEGRRRSIEKIKIRLEDAGIGGSSEVLKEFKETEDRDTFLVKELSDLEKSRDELTKLIKELDARIDMEFKSGIMKINERFDQFFRLMFGGGKAELNVVKEVRRKRRTDMEDLNNAMQGIVPEMNDAEENLPEGIEVSVNLPKKKVKSLIMLSGGERALTSIALLFAISQVNPPPFIILDETDAALDEANSKKYGDMIENLAQHSQLILITHNRETMSRAGVLYGITMGSDGASRLLSVAFEQAVAVAK
jgi:chromosome segregation protein